MKPNVSAAVASEAWHPCLKGFCRAVVEPRLGKLGWRPEGVHFVVPNRRCGALEMVEDAPDDGGVLYARDDLHAATARLGWVPATLPRFVRRGRLLLSRRVAQHGPRSHIG